MSSPQSACAAGAGSGSPRRPTRRACSAALPLVLGLGLRVALRGLLLGLSRPLGRVPGLRLACAGVVGEAARLVLGARDGVGQHGGAEHRGVERGLHRHDRRGHHGRDRRRHRTATLRGQVQLVRGTCRDVRFGAGQRRRAAGDGDGRHGGDADTAQDGRGQGRGDRGCMRRAAGPAASRTPEQREREGRELAAASGGAMPSHDQPSGSDGGGWTSGWGETGGWGVPCPSRDRVVMNPLMNLGPVPRVTTPRATTVRHRAPNVDLRDLTAATPPAFMWGQHGAPVVRPAAR